MREMNTRLTQAKRIRVRRRFVCRPALVLYLLSGVVGFTLWSERNLPVGSARPKQSLGRRAELGTLIPLVSALESAAARREILKSDRSEDGIWRPTEKSASKRMSAEVDGGRKFYRALSLDEAAQKKLLSRAPMEF